MEVLTKGLELVDIGKILVTNVIAFLILVWVLAKYAWGPMMSVLDQRRDKIKSQYDAAADKLGEAEQLRQDYARCPSRCRSARAHRWGTCGRSRQPRSARPS
jgi:hypothetical protein